VFVLTNAGDENLRFPRQPSTSCGCTSAPLPRGELAPGESLELTVYFDSTGFGGQEVERHVVLYTNDPQRKEFYLTIRGNVEEAPPFQGSASSLNYSFYLLVDLRPPEEYAQGHLLGAVNVPFGELPGWLDRLPREAVIYLYDATGVEGVQAAQLLQAEGYAAARAIAGGLVGWWNAVGESFFVWGEGVEPAPFTGTPHYGGYSVQPQYVARSYQVIVDLRSPEEYAAGHFPGAVNLTLQEIPDWAVGLPPIGQGKLYIWCVDADGTAACQAAQWLRESGYPNARCLAGGLGEWLARYGDGLLWP
jgi:rhodanese-related sulfurtransferase